MRSPPMPRARDLGLPVPGRPGPLNAITDLPGVEVGCCPLTDPARNVPTGVTDILPRPGTLPQPVWAGQELNIEDLEPLYLAAVEAIEEAVVNARVAAGAVSTFRPAGCICPALDTARLCTIFAE